MKLIIILIFFTASVYIFPVCYVFYHSYCYVHYADESCETCIDIFSIVKAVNKILIFFNIYNTFVYFGISYIFIIKIKRIIFNFNNNPTSLKVKLIN